MGVSVSIERLRIWLLVGAGLLVMMIAGFLGYAHYRAHRFIKDLPSKLGMDITQETNAFTYSQSVQGKTLFTIHAAKAVQRKDGKVTLHDVGIVLYGRKQDRADRIYGSEFEYDQHAGVIRAMGEVHLDLQAPTATDASGKADYAAGKDLHGPNAVEEGGNRLIHVKTSGLVFLRELGVAATDQDIEFEFNGMNGHAKGADYSSDTGVLVLQSAVKVNGLEHGQPVVLTAARAELDRVNNRINLAQPRYVSVGETAGGGETAQAQKAIIYLRKKGSAERVEAEGQVTMTQSGGGEVVAQRALAVLNENSRPEAIRLYDGVRYGADEPLRQAKGGAGEARATFDKAGRLEHVLLNGAVQLDERVRTSAGVNDPWNQRELAAGAVELAFAAMGGGSPQIRDAKASGDARLKIVNASNAGREATNSTLAGDVLMAQFVHTEGIQKLAAVQGTGHTMLRRVSAAGVEDTSSGDTIDVQFRSAKADARSTAEDAQARRLKVPGVDGAEEISTAVQQGNVVMVHKPMRKPGDTRDAGELHATSPKAMYDGVTEKVTLTGGVKVSDEGSALLADRVVMEQKTGDASAEGSVKASYLQAKTGETASDEVVHVLAARAELKRAVGQTTFYGASGGVARLWQGGSQVEAPLIQFGQQQRTLLARGEGQGRPMAVRAVLVTSGERKGDTRPGIGRTGAVHVTSRELSYSDELRKAEFSGGVQVDSADSRMRGQQAVVYLQRAGAGGSKAGATDKSSGLMKVARSGGFLGGSVERVIVTGKIEMEQPGRHATGEQLAYTADDGTFVLTGTAAAPPRVIDEVRGMITGASLQFRSGDESVVISNGVNHDAGQRVRTETRVKRY